MNKRYSVDRLAMLEADDKGIGSPVDFADEIANLLGDEPDVEGSDDGSAEGDEEDEESGDGVKDGDDSEIEPSGEETDDEPGETPPTIPAKEPAEGDVKSTEVEDLKAQIASLTGMINEMKTPPKEEEPEKGLELPPVDLKELFKDVDFDTVMETKEGFLEFLAKAMAVTQSSTVDKVLNSIPGMVGNVVDRQSSMKEIATKFYGDFPELAGVKKYVSHVANEISVSDPNLTMEEVLVKAAEKTKTDLGIKGIVKKEEGEGTPEKKKKPTLPGGSQSVKGKKETISKQQSEIDDLIND